MDKKNQPQKSSTTDWPDPIAFLTDYKDFAVNARLLLINLIAEKHRKTQNRDEKKLLHTLGLEQIAFFIESLESFFVAVTQKGSVDIYRWLRAPYNSINQEVKLLEENQYFKIYKSIFTDLKDDDLRKIAKDLADVTKDMQWKADFHKYLLQWCAKIKHKFLVYREDEEVRYLLAPQWKKALEKAFKSEITQTNEYRRSWAEDMKWLVEIAEMVKDNICILIDNLIIRLQHEQRVTNQSSTTVEE